MSIEEFEREIKSIANGGSATRNRKVYEYIMRFELRKIDGEHSLFDLYDNGLIPQSLYPVLDDYYRGDWDYIHPDQFLLSPSWFPTRGYVYLVKLENGLYKIGKSKHLSTRMSVFAVSFPMKWELYYSFLSNDYTVAEKTLHMNFAEKRQIGEWFSLDQRDVNSIMAIKDFEL